MMKGFLRHRGLFPLPLFELATVGTAQFLPQDHPEHYGQHQGSQGHLTIAVRDNRDLTKLDVDIAEARCNLRDVRGILSHTLVPYTQQTGRAVLKSTIASVRS